MIRADLRDVVDRLEEAKKHIVHSMLDGSPSDEGAACAMWAMVQIEHVLGMLRNELQGGDDEPTSSEPSEIRGMVETLSRRAPQ